MKVLSILKTKNVNHGGPPEVLRNQIKVINDKTNIISVLQLNYLSITFFLRCIFSKNYRLRIYNFLKKYDLVHFHEIWSLKVVFIIYFLNKLLIKHFFVGHGYIDSWSINQKFFKKKTFIFLFLQKAFNSSSASFFSTYNEYLDVIKNIKVHDTFIIPNGVSLEKYKERKLIKKKNKKILFFGRIHPKKGLDLLIETIKDLPDDYFNEFSFEITGPGNQSYINRLKKLIKKYNLEKKVNYNPPIYKDDKIEYLKKNDVFILPSFEEGDSIALKEALGSYLPVIISKQCRLDIVDQYNAGIVIETNKKSLYEGLIKLRTKDIVEMGNQARKLATDKFDNKVCSERLYKIYCDIYNGKKNSNDWIL